MLSSDILTKFRGRGDEIRVNPLSFSEFHNAYAGDKHDAWREYSTYGDLPLVKNRGTKKKAVICKDCLTRYIYPTLWKETAYFTKDTYWTTY